VRADLEALKAEAEGEVQALDTGFDALTAPLDEVVVRAKTTDIHVPLVALVWMPYAKGDDGRLAPAWT
jgi:hypothetical protein